MGNREDGMARKDTTKDDMIKKKMSLRSKQMAMMEDKIATMSL